MTGVGTNRSALRRAFRALAVPALLGVSLFVFAGAKAACAHPVTPQIPAAQHTPAPSSAGTVPTPSGMPEQEVRQPTSRYSLTHEQYDRAVRYSRIGYTLHFVAMIFDFVILLLVLRLGIAARFRDWAERATENRFLQGCLFVPLLFFALAIADLPIDLYWHSLSLKYAQSVQGYGSWMLDWLKEQLIIIIVGVVLVQILFAFLRHSPRRWWLWFWTAALPILIFIFFISPWFIAPLFNKFEPLEQSYPQVVAGIERVLHRSSMTIPRERIFLMRASEKTNQINAYVTGIGASKRVVVWDTLIQKTSPDEVMFVVGHEVGHYMLHHIRDGFVFFAVLLLIELYVAYMALERLLARGARRWKIYSRQDWAALAVVLLILQGLMFFSEPIENGFSRMQEHAADVYGLELIHGIVPNSPEVAAHAFQVLGEIDLSDPNPSPFITFWLYSHPPLADRLVFAHTYDPWSKGESPKYVK